MKIKSINIFCISCLALTSSACMQELVDKNYTPTVAGYKRQADESAIFAVGNKSANSQQTSNAQNNIPILFTDPYATGRSLGNQPAQQAVAPNYSSPYGSLGYAPSGTFNSGVIMPNTLPYYQQPVVGNNYYAPQRR